ncbi:MAG: bifunctional DNA-formamidopyrimidine glycosylase/DNA-(apurinic or apyrimidinic site) lyase [Pirellulaceae bacterium]
MPELPEVETMRRGVLPVVGARITGIGRPACRLHPILVSPRLSTFQRHVVGSQIQRLDRLGKRLLVWLDTDHAMVFEPRMTGLVLLSDPPSHEHLRFRVDLQGTQVAHLWYWDRRGLGSVRLLDRRQVEQQLGPARLGPDALGLDAQQLRERLAHRRVPVKVALLDQSALAGVGNLYASEILHVARIHPGTRCDRLTRGQWLRLANSMSGVLEEAIRYEGSTLADGTYRTALNHPGRYQNCHRVYDRAGNVCASCGQAEIQRIVQAQRATFFCPACQAAKSR